jgi:hypothetical protein
MIEKKKGKEQTTRTAGAENTLSQLTSTGRSAPVPAKRRGIRSDEQRKKERKPLGSLQVISPEEWNSGEPHGAPFTRTAMGCLKSEPKMVISEPPKEKTQTIFKKEEPRAKIQTFSGAIDRLGSR